ncbi:hypothetical protein LEP1GSC061_1394 [Leptospira wolffii serovar Khorat str. Khorat-H2]|nr:hypothetical protein LEP1GSC061_1394 [Leptospira wolffii serovar Khorat str. Khorat-H2]
MFTFALPWKFPKFIGISSRFSPIPDQKLGNPPHPFSKKSLNG